MTHIELPVKTNAEIVSFRGAYPNPVGVGHTRTTQLSQRTAFALRSM